LLSLGIHEGLSATIYSHIMKVSFVSLRLRDSGDGCLRFAVTNWRRAQGRPWCGAVRRADLARQVRGLAGRVRRLGG
jgi:hypothetical protein